MPSYPSATARHFRNQPPAITVSQALQLRVGSDSEQVRCLHIPGNVQILRRKR
jgi:hypothetical protein